MYNDEDKQLRSSDMQAVILAGGKGTRLRQAVSDRPKPMADINGEPFLNHLITWWGSQCNNEVMISVGYMKDYVRDYYGSKFNGIKIMYIEENEPLGTGGAVRLALRDQNLNSDLVVIANGDTWFPVEIVEMKNMLETLKTNICIGGCKVKNAQRYGRIEWDAMGIVTKFLEPSGENAWINGGVYLMRREAVSRLIWDMEDKFSLDDLLRERVRALDVAFMGCSKIFVDIGVPADYEYAKTILGAS